MNLYKQGNGLAGSVKWTKTCCSQVCRDTVQFPIESSQTHAKVEEAALLAVLGGDLAGAAATSITTKF